MSNQEHLDILEQGVKAWNQWRKEHPGIMPDLNGANLLETNLSGAHLSDTDLSRADLSRADLSFANLFRVNLSFANLFRVNLSHADLTNAVLSEAVLIGAVLTNAVLSGADLSGASVAGTVFANIDFRQVKGLGTLIHKGPSEISIGVIYRSQGNIPEVFLREAGVPETFITNMRALVDSMSPIDFYSCFISYSSNDHAFAQRLHADLQSKGVRCWFAPEDLKIGEEFWPRIDESIRLYDKLLVVLSEYSVNSAWVEIEVMAALEKEQQQQKLVLFPIKLDETVMQTNLPWAANIRRTRHVGDFTKWKEHDEYQKGLNRLLRDLKAEAEKTG